MIKPEDIKLPKEIKVSDLKYPSWKSKDRLATSFELWFTERFEWCIPTLLISRASRRSSQTTDRTYGIALDGQIVRIGRGPHVLKTVTVYVKESRKEKLQKFLDLKLKGEQGAGEIRDNISTRRANSALNRGGGAWWS